MNAEVGRDEDRGGNVFHAGTEVRAEIETATLAKRKTGALTAKDAKYAKAERPKPEFFTAEDAEYTERKKGNCGPPAARPQRPVVLEGSCLRRRKWADDRVAPEPFVEEGFAFAPVRRVYGGRLGRGQDNGLRPYGTL